VGAQGNDHHCGGFASLSLSKAMITAIMSTVERTTVQTTTGIDAMKKY
jgi:hypothetical protein